MLLYIIINILFAHTFYINADVDLEVAYKRNHPDSLSKNEISPEHSNDELPTIPIPFIHIKSSSFEDVQRYAESVLEKHLAAAPDSEDIDDNDVHEQILSILAKINKLEAIRAHLSAEERITRAAITKGITTDGSYIPVPYPVSVNPVFS